jgi:hypothetical protein
VKKLIFIVITFIFLLTILETSFIYAIRKTQISSVFYDLEPFSSKLLEINWVKQTKNNLHSLKQFGFEFNKKTGWSFIKEAKSYTEKNGSTFNINKSGYRNTGKFHGKNLPTIAVIGDSFAFGSEVDDKHSLPFLLNQKSKKYNVINLAVPAYGHGQMLLNYKNNKLNKNIKHTLLIFLETDMYRNVMSFRDFGKPSFHNNNGILEIKTDHLVSPKQLLQSSSTFAITGVLSLIKKYFDDKFSTPELIQTSHVILKKMKREAKEVGSKFTVIFAPQLVLDHRKKEINTQNFYRYETAQDKIFHLKALLKESHIDFHDIRSEVFHSYFSGSNYYTPDNGEHWSINANYDISQIIHKKLGF